MPRQLKEIRNFNIGTITNADMREVSGEAASNSQGIDPNAPNGVLRGNLLDKYKNANINHARYKIDTGVDTTGSYSDIGTQVAVSSVEDFFVGEIVVISTFAFTISKIDTANSKLVLTAVFSPGRRTISAGNDVYKDETPLHAI